MVKPNPGTWWLLALAAAAVTWGALGDLSEAGGADVMLDLPQSADVALFIGLIGVALGAAVAKPVWNTMQASGAPAIRLAISVAVAGGFAALTLRVVSAKTNGANIGGGILLMVAPFVAALPYAAWRHYRAELVTPSRSGPMTDDVLVAAEQLIARGVPTDEAIAELRAQADRDTLLLAARHAQQSLNWSLGGGKRRKVWQVLDAAADADK